jgi:hypothetical protein
MRPRFCRCLLLFTMLSLALCLSACGLLREPHTAATPSGRTPVQANPGEREGTIPAAAAKQAPPTQPAATAGQAVERFAVGYINWTYASLSGDEARLAASAIGEARASEEQAEAQLARDTALKRAHIYNTGNVIAVSPVAGAGNQEWVLVTRERTGGDGEYAATRPAFHVTLARVQHVAGGFSVSAWRPQV